MTDSSSPLSSNPRKHENHASRVRNPIIPSSTIKKTLIDQFPAPPRSPSSLSSRQDYGPPLHPAPATPVPSTPGAPRVLFTTPAQEWDRYSSDKLREAIYRKRYLAPHLRTHLSLPLPTPVSADIRRTSSWIFWAQWIIFLRYLFSTL
jgi:hypothetical protein